MSHTSSLSKFSIFVVSFFALPTLVKANLESTPNIKRVEVSIGRVFIPSLGFDNNDNVQFVIDGMLPNGCYKIGDHKEFIDTKKGTIQTHLFADLQTDGLCANQKSGLSNSLLAPVPYSIEVSVGSLAVGPYEIHFKRPGNIESVQKFSVALANNSLIDDVPYAAVSSIWISDTVRGDLPVEAQLTGTLTSACSFLTDEVAIKQLGDVFVVLQTVGFNTEGFCAMVMTPFKKTLNLGTLAEGRYLLHVRSMNGRSVNRVFQSVIPDPSAPAANVR